MNKLLTVTFLLLGLGLSTTVAQVINPVNKREDLLKGMQETIGNTSAEVADYGKAASPFVPKAKPVRQEKEIIEAPVEEVMSTERLPDSVALKVIGKRFEPIGSLVLGNRGVLQLANGEYLEAGQTFPARIQGNTYQVKVTEVTSQGYSLTLGTATIRKNFITTNGATQ